MKRLAFILTLLASSALAATDDDHVAARNKAFEMAGAWSNDGFKIRDGFWSGSLKVGEAKIVQVNLYAGNQYWFTLAGNDRAKKVAVTVYDERGKPVAGERVQDGARAAAGFSATVSGPYLVKVELLEGAPSAFAMIYSFK